LFTASEENIIVIYNRNETAEFLYSLHFEADDQKHAIRKSKKNVGS
jgi:hypothetical protein